MPFCRYQQCTFYSAELHACVSYSLLQADPAALDWAPKEFTEDGDEEEDTDQQGGGGAAAGAVGDTSGRAVQQEQQQDADLGSSAAQGDMPSSSEYVYDPSTG